MLPVGVNCFCQVQIQQELLQPNPPFFRWVSRVLLVANLINWKITRDVNVRLPRPEIHMGRGVVAVHETCEAFETPQGNVSLKPVAPLFRCVLRGGCGAWVPCRLLSYSQEITTTRVDEDKSRGC